LKRNRISTGIIAVIIAAGLLLSGCSGSKDTGKTTAGKEPYKIGAVIDISGTSSSLGVPGKNTLQMLADKVNAAWRHQRPFPGTDHPGQQER